MGRFEARKEGHEAPMEALFLRKILLNPYLLWSDQEHTPSPRKISLEGKKEVA